MVRRVTVEQWITSAASDTDKGAPCTAIALLHVKGIGTEEVHAKELPPGVPQSFSQLAEFFVNKACGFAQDMPGLQSFRLQAFYGGKTEPQASFTFTVFEGSLTAGDAAPWSKHEPTGTGVLALVMKNNEHMLSQITQLTMGFTGMLIQRDVAHQAEKAEMTVLMRDVLLNMNKENREAAMEQARFKRESEERAMLARAAPSLINYLSGREVIPTAHADSQIIESLGLKVTPEHLQMLVSMKLITSQESLVLAARFAQIKEEAEKRSKALAVIPTEGTDNAETKST